MDRAPRLLIALLVAAALTACGTAGKGSGQVDKTPSCPTEDSCQPEYGNGEWVIVEVTP